MKNMRRSAELLMLAMVVAFMPELLQAHVTLQTAGPLKVKGFATVVLNVPNERFVDNTKVTVAVPESFLKAGGRVNRVQYPTGWTVTLEKTDKPSEVLLKEKADRGKKDAKKEAAGADHGPKAAKAEEDKKEKQAMDELRKKWITKVTFEGGAIPPDGFQQFEISFQMPDEPGRFRFPAVQTYSDGKEVAWTELVEGAEHPAPSLNIQKPSLITTANLPLPLAGLAVLISIAGVVRKPKASGKPESESAMLTGRRLANA